LVNQDLKNRIEAVLNPNAAGCSGFLLYGSGKLGDPEGAADYAAFLGSVCVVAPQVDGAAKAAAAGQVKLTARLGAEVAWAEATEEGREQKGFGLWRRRQTG
jgi:hypothetical protein